ncbi:MAG: monofunctional biosynthetic peptidoglycan transglycosylase [Saprospiraceae bacterium]|nr:monofunctional biosynthetic peptidoglycan transglycosylase [Saprospiraceae bacterium]
MFITLFKNYFLDLILFICTISVFLVLLFRWCPVPSTLLMITKAFSSDEMSYDYRWVKKQNISDFLKVCAIASEDQNFPFHYGLDVSAIDDALKSNKKGKRIRGASTITQQVAKNLFLWPGRSYVRKMFELPFTFLLETLWKKERILEVYLNIAEMGDGIFGAEAAAQYYFRKSSIQISLQEAALLIAILPNPIKYNALRPGSYVSGRRDKIVRLYHTLDGNYYLREQHVRAENSLYDFKNYKE